MKCIVCNSEDISLSKVNEEIHVDNNIVMVPIEVLVCRNCGERYYDRKTVKYLEKVDRDLRNHKNKLREVGKVLQLD